MNSAERLYESRIMRHISPLHGLLLRLMTELGNDTQKIFFWTARMALLALMLRPVLLDTSMVMTNYDKVLQRTVQQI